jgi:hypothetical protein
VLTRGFDGAHHRSPEALCHIAQGLHAALASAPELELAPERHALLLSQVLHKTAWAPSPSPAVDLTARRLDLLGLLVRCPGPAVDETLRLRGARVAEVLTPILADLAGPALARRAALHVATAMLARCRPAGRLRRSNPPPAPGACRAAARLATPIVDRLCDASGPVRLAALDAAHELLFYLDMDHKPTDAQAGTGVMGFRAFVEVCAGMSPRCPDDDFRDGVEGLLRLAAVRDPAEFLEIIRSRTGAEEADPDLRSALEDHAETLIALGAA